jgi:dihydropteroate synthase
LSTIRRVIAPAESRVIDSTVPAAGSVWVDVCEPSAWMIVDTRIGAKASCCAPAAPAIQSHAHAVIHRAAFLLEGLCINPDDLAAAAPGRKLFPMRWRTRTHTFDFDSRALLMGVLNVTPDSFSDGGAHADPARALDHALGMVAAGADIVDIGGESTRPGASPVDAAEERRRVVPVVRALRAASPVPISVDTRNAAVAAAALDAGADIINDISALRHDPGMAAAVASAGAGLVLMHMRGAPASMQHDPRYGDVCTEVLAFLGERIAAAERLGIDPETIAVDPGIGFGKTVAHNLALLRDLARFTAFGRPVLVGVSRKSFLGRVLGLPDPGDRLWAGVAIASNAREKGARILRVHDVMETRDAVRMTEAILHAP